MLLDPTTPEYARATTPHNSATPQAPRAVAVANSADDVAAAIAQARAEGLVVVPQATGHGAGAPLDHRHLLLDTSGLSAVHIDPTARVARVGAGATWSAVNAAAEQHGLLGLSGSAPTVAVSGYTFAGGIGWLVRRDGLAAAALRSVRYVDGRGAVRVTTDDAPDEVDREAMWAFRGAGGVGVATELEIDLFPATALHAGTLLWAIDDLGALVDAWSTTLDPDDTVATSIAVLHIPPAPPFPEALRGRPAAVLSIADPAGPDGARPVLDAVRAAGTPVLDTWGPADAARLAQIHLDPPDPVPAVGDARWLDAGAPQLVAALLGAASPDDSPLIMTEVRHVGALAGRRAGALTTPVSPFVHHSVGLLGRSTPEAIHEGFAQMRALWSATDAGLTPGSWTEGAAHVAEALPSEICSRASAVADAVDPDQRLHRSRLLTGG